MNILIIQKNTGKAGAQNSLRRLLSADEFKKHSVVVVAGKKGWFVEQIRKQGVSVILVDFPACRSIYGRALGKWVWLNAVVRGLSKINFVPDILVANNHVEAPFLKILKGQYQRAVSAVFLRDGYLTKTDYYKYRCDECDIRIAVSENMLNIVSWDEGAVLINNGVFETEIYSPLETKADFPDRWLVVGNPNVGKGWFDFLSAFSQLQKQGYTDSVKKIVFTGIPVGELKSLYAAKCNEFEDGLQLEFVEPFEDLGQACREFDLIVVPSRKESFGMAILEACCSRVCVISARTGIAEDIVLDPNLLFTPGNLDELVASIKYAVEEWPNISGISENGLEVVRRYFSVEHNVKQLLLHFQEVLGAVKI